MMHSDGCPRTDCFKQKDADFIYSIKWNFERFVTKEVDHMKYDPLAYDYEVYIPLSSSQILGWYDDGFYICNREGGNGRWIDLRGSKSYDPVTWWHKLILLYRDLFYR